MVNHLNENSFKKQFENSYQKTIVYGEKDCEDRDLADETFYVDLGDIWWVIVCVNGL